MPLLLSDITLFLKLSVRIQYLFLHYLWLPHSLPLSLPTYVFIIFPKQDIVFSPYIRKRKKMSIILFFTLPLYTLFMVQNNASTNAAQFTYTFLYFPSVNISI